MDQLPVAASLKSFSNVRGRRNGRATNRITQNKVSGKLATLGNTIHRLFQLPGLLPGFDVLELRDRGHNSSRADPKTRNIEPETSLYFRSLIGV